MKSILSVAIALITFSVGVAEAQSMRGDIVFRGTSYKTYDSCANQGPDTIPVDLRLSWVNYVYHVVRDRWSGATMDGLPTGRGVHVQGTFPAANGVRVTIGYTFTNLNKSRKTSDLRQIFIFERGGFACSYQYNARVRGR